MTFTGLTIPQLGNNTLSGNIFGGSRQGTATYYKTATNTGALEFNFENLNPLTPPCFNKGSKILCLNKETHEEEYKVVESLRKGDLVKTLNNGFLAIHMVGYQDIYNTSSENHHERMLYKCSQDKYPELLEDLIITGHHSILVSKITEAEREAIGNVLGKIYATDKKYRLPACVDKRASPYKKEGIFTVYHFALENDNDYTNYGVYANGLLVETCSKRYLRDLSGMHFIDST
jgi:hypothetical protein